MKPQRPLRETLCSPKEVLFESIGEKSWFADKFSCDMVKRRDKEINTLEDTERCNKKQLVADDRWLYLLFPLCPLWLDFYHAWF